MTLLIVALLVAGTIATGIVLADSGLRVWSALGGIRSQQAMLRDGRIARSGMRMSRPARVTTKVSYVRAMPAPLRAAA